MSTMTPEERFNRIERTLEFIANNQAHHDAQIAENSRHIEENARLIREHSQLIAGNSQQLGELTGLTLRIARAVEAQGRHIDRVAERVDTVIAAVERYVSDRPR